MLYVLWFTDGQSFVLLIKLFILPLCLPLPPPFLLSPLQKMFGVCIHPRLGGWFAIRAMLVFVGSEVGSELQQTAPPDCVPTREDRIQLLENFNLRWQVGFTLYTIVITIDQ